VDPHQGGKRIDAELLFQAEARVEVQFAHDGVMAYGRRFAVRELAVEEAEVQRRLLLAERLFTEARSARRRTPRSVPGVYKENRNARSTRAARPCSHLRQTSRQESREKNEPFKSIEDVREADANVAARRQLGQASSAANRLVANHVLEDSGGTKPAIDCNSRASARRGPHPRSRL
jgi:hypothetical protein